MTTYENGCVETPEWLPEPRCCPFDRDCGVCETPQQALWMHTPDSIVLGEN